MTQQTVEVERLLGELGEALHRYQARRRRRVVQFLTIAAVVTAAGTALGATYGVLWGVSPPFTTLKAPLALPRFSGKDVLSGRRIDNADIAGRRGFLIIWQSYCRPCISDLAAVQSFAAANPATPIIGFDVNDVPAYARKLIVRMHITFPSIAADTSTIERLNIVGYPTVLAFDTHGQVVAIAAGATTSAQTLKAALKRLVA